jgi:hypothetical protein
MFIISRICASHKNIGRAWKPLLNQAMIEYADELKNYLEPRILNNIKTQPEMKIIRDNQVTLNYNYRDRTGAHLLTISVEPKQYK